MVNKKRKIAFYLFLSGVVMLALAIFISYVVYIDYLYDVKPFIHAIPLFAIPFFIGVFLLVWGLFWMRKYHNKRWW